MQSIYVHNNPEQVVAELNQIQFSTKFLRKKVDFYQPTCEIFPLESSLKRFIILCIHNIHSRVRENHVVILFLYAAL